MCQGGSGLTVLFSETAPACGLNFLSQEHCPVSSSGWWPWLCPGSTVVITLLLTEPADAGRVGSLTQHQRKHLPQFMTWFV